MISTILFDLDGTLTDPKLGITRCVQHALAHFGIIEPDLDKLEVFIGPPLQEMFASYAHLDWEQAAEAVAVYRERFAPVGIFENEVYPGIPEMLGRLREAGLHLGLATSKPEVYARRILDHFGLTPLLDEVTGSELSGERTHKDDVIREAMRRMHADPGSTLMVGDREHDIIGAHAAGIPCIGVLFGYGSEAELSAAGAEALAQDPADLVQQILTICSARP